MAPGGVEPPLAASFRLGVDLGAEEKGERGEPEPGEHDDDGREGAPRLVVRAEPAHVEGEDPRGDEPDGDGEDGSRRDEVPAVVLDVRPQVEDAGEGEEEPDYEDRP